MFLVTLPYYILRELVKALGLSLLIFGMILLAFFAGKMMQDGAGIFTVLAMIHNLFPLASPMVLPLTVVTGTLICYGRFSGSNEYTAALAGGVHPGWLAMPALVVSILATSITVFLNADVLDAATANIERAILADMTDILRRQLSRPGSFFFHNRGICRLKAENGRAGIDITEFSSEPDRAYKKNPRWNASYPHQVGRILAQDHEIGLTEDQKGELFVEIKLNQFQHFNLTGREVQMQTGAFGPPRWPATTDVKIDISGNRLTYKGIISLLKMRNSIRQDIDPLICSIVRKEQVTDWNRLYTLLQQDDPKTSNRLRESLWRLLAPAEREAIRAGAIGTAVNAEQKLAILKRLNTALGSQAVFPLHDLGDIAKRPEIAKLLKQLEGGTLYFAGIVRLNRLIMEAALPGVIIPHKKTHSGALARAAFAATLPEAGNHYAKILRSLCKSYRKRTAEIHLKLALSFACLAFALVAIPLGLINRRQSTAIGFSYGILIALGYFLLVKAMQSQVRAGHLHWIAIWVPNAILVAMSAWCWWRSRRLD